MLWVPIFLLFCTRKLKKGIKIAFGVLASAQVLFGVFLKVSLVIEASLRLDCTREGWFSPTPALIYDITPSTSNTHTHPGCRSDVFGRGQSSGCSN